ncbi:MAG: HD domain-containing protein [Candidatus Tantalella remota]|nr:HD domain-containing protein [Candidatus Tantalella remota]
MAELENLRNRVEDMINKLARASGVSVMYGEDHGLTDEAIESLHKEVTEILLEEEELTVGIIEDEIAFKEEPFYRTSVRIKGFIDQLKELGVGKMTFLRGLEKKELMVFNRCLNVNPRSFDEEEGFRKIFEAERIEHIIVGKVGVGASTGTQKKSAGAPEDDASKQYEEGVDFLAKTYKDVKGNQPMDVEAARQVADGLLRDVLKNKDLLLTLTSLRSHDEDVFQHSVNVSVFTLMQSEALGIDEKHLVDIGMASLMHDVGKLTLPSEDAEKYDEPESEEEEKARGERNVEGAKILLDSPGISILAAIAAFEHDMDYDMSGYPKKLYGKELNLISMMIAISDYYDRERSKPEYYKEDGPENVYAKMMEQSGKKFHPDLLNNFFSLIGLYPPGTLVELDTKEVALVIRASVMDIRRPQVEILYDASGEKYEEPVVVNLLEKDKKGKFKWSVVKSIPLSDKFKVPEKYS